MYIVFDVGGTHLRVGLSSNLERLDLVKVLDTPHNFDAGLQLLTEEITTMLGGHKCTRIIGGLPGVVDKGSGELTKAANLADWGGKPLMKDLEAKFHAPVDLINDSMLAALGEAVYGPGKGHKIVAYLGFGTGLGGARIVDGRIDEYALGFEPGHQIVQIETTGKPVVIESIVAGRGITAHTNWDRVHTWAAIAIHNTNVYWSPDIIVLGGGLFNTKLTLAGIQQKLNTLPNIFANYPQIVLGELRQEAGLWGGVAYLLNISK